MACVAVLISAQDHWRSLREHQNDDHVAHLLLSQSLHAFISRFALRSTVPREIVIVTVIIVLAIRVVVFLIVRHEIVESEAVMGHDEIDGMKGLAIVVLVEIG